MDSLRVDTATAMSLTGRSARTVARWCAGGIDDRACLVVLQIHTYGILPHARWQEWRMDTDGFLVHRSGRHVLRFQPGHLHDTANAYALAAAVQARAKALQATIDALRAQIAAQERPARPGDAANDDTWHTPQLALPWP